MLDAEALARFTEALTTVSVRRSVEREEDVAAQAEFDQADATRAERQFALQERQIAALERIAAALEARAVADV